MKVLQLFFFLKIAFAILSFLHLHVHVRIRLPAGILIQIMMTLSIRGVKFIFTGDHISLKVAFKGSNVILGLYKCNYSLTRGKELGAAAG